MKTHSSFIKKYFFIICLLFASVSISPSVLCAEPIREGEILTMEKAVEIALKNHPSIDAQICQVKAGEAKTGQSQAGFYPQLTVSSGYIRISPVDTETSSRTSQEYKAVVTIVDQVIDAASGTFGVRLSLANLQRRVPAGIKCKVVFP